MRTCEHFFAAAMCLTVAALFLGCTSEISNMSDGPQTQAQSQARTYSVSGAVSKSDGGAATGASIALLKTDDGSAAGQAVVNTSGGYIITGVSAGSYSITAALNGYESGGVSAVTVSNADVTVADITLNKITVATYTVSGVVTKPDGSPAAGAVVQIKRADDNTNVGQAATTDANGAYSISGVPVGDYKIIISLNGYETGVIADVQLNESNLTVQNVALKVIEMNAESVYITFSGNQATVVNPYAGNGVTVTASGANVSVVSTSTKLTEYVVSGTTNSGSLTIESASQIRLTLQNAYITASGAPAIRITSDVIAEIQLKESNSLADGSNNTKDAALDSKGSLIFDGYGALELRGAAKHAVAANHDISVREGNITISAATLDGFHATNFAMSGGTLNITAGSDAIDAEGGTAAISGGSIVITSTATDVKGIAADEAITVSGGTVTMSISGAQSKGFGCQKNITVSGGTISIVTSGAAAVISGDPSYCTAMKAIGSVTVSEGTVMIESRSTADGGKGISADADITVNGGTLNIAVSGNGKTYTNASGVTDSYTAACLKSNGNIVLNGGSITCSSSGTGGKGISADGTITLGKSGGATPALVLTVGTTGSALAVSGSTSGNNGRPGGFGVPGGNNTNAANPKAIKCDGNMTVNSGTITISCSQSGGEGLESKSQLTINGGTIDIRTYDDCINAGTGIIINGGNIYCAASGQDAIDCNGSVFTVNGGFLMANGVRGDGESLDSDREISINGGTVIGVCGSENTRLAGTQKNYKFTASCGSALCIKNSSGEALLLFTVPVISGASTGTSVTVIFSEPRLVSGTYTLLSGGTLSGGTTVNGYNTGGTYSGGTSKAFSL
ncbi:MAG: carbohydrate-binding domain-containing protein [Bacteroidales bacterium]|nr:carbohydrate-binding domain-containing protein [Bacteroidales bacterium]